MIVGLVAEGPSDHIILEGIVRAVLGDVECRYIHPEETLESRERGSGWKGVRRWCREHADGLPAFLSAITPRIDLLVVHLDCSMAHNVGGDFPCPPARDRARRLEAVLAEWLAVEPRPGWLLFATPSWTSEAWLAAALPPPQRHMAEPECDDPEVELYRRRMLRRDSRSGAIKKPKRLVRQYVEEHLIPGLTTVTTQCPEAARFRQALLERAGQPEDSDPPSS